MQNSLFLDENIPPETNQGRGAELRKYAQRYNNELKIFLGDSTIPNARALKFARRYVGVISRSFPGKVARLLNLTPRIEAANNILRTKRQVGIEPWSKPTKSV